MPAPGWKTVALTVGVYEELAVLAAELDRPINWTANKAIEYALSRCLDPLPVAGDEEQLFRLNPLSAEELGLR